MVCLTACRRGRRDLLDCAAFSNFMVAFSSVIKSAKAISTFRVSASLVGSTFPATWATSSLEKERRTSQTASQSRICPGTDCLDPRRDWLLPPSLQCPRNPRTPAPEFPVAQFHLLVPAGCRVQGLYQRWGRW